MDGFRKAVAAVMGNTQAAALAANSTTLYKVQTGAFSQKANATALAAKVKAAGFGACIVQSGEYYKVQVGVYSVKANAEATEKKLKAAGFNACITT
jgi:cell division protein FtsN